MKSFRIIALVLAIAFAFSGCMNTQNLKDLTVVQGLGVDVDGANTKITLQYLNLAKSGSATDALNGTITTTANGSANNISDAISVAAKSLSQKIFFGQNKIIVFGNEYSKIGIDKGLDYLLRSIDSRPDVLVAISSDTAEDVIKSTQNGARIPAENIYQLLRVGQDNGLGAVVTVNDLLNLYADETSDIYLPLIKTEDKLASCQGIVVFSDNKSVKTLDGWQTFGFLFVKNKINGGSLTVKSDEFGYVGLEIIDSVTKCRVSTQDSKITFHCDISVVLLLNELEKGITTDLTPAKINDIQKLVENQVEDMCNSAVFACTQSKSDPFMIGRYLAKEDARIYASLKDNWHDYLTDVEFSAKVDAKLKNVNDNSVRE